VYLATGKDPAPSTARTTVYYDKEMVRPRHTCAEVDQIVVVRFDPFQHQPVIISHKVKMDQPLFRTSPEFRRYYHPVEGIPCCCDIHSNEMGYITVVPK
jgi:hypothetical protein